MSKARLAALGCGAAASIFPASMAHAASIDENDEVTLRKEDPVFYVVPQDWARKIQLSNPYVYANPNDEPTLDPHGLIFSVLPQSWLPKGRQATPWPEDQEVTLDPHAHIFYAWPQQWLPAGWKEWIAKQEKERDTEMHEEAKNDLNNSVFYVRSFYLSPLFLLITT
jgi:hypothetical protein